MIKISKADSLTKEKILANLNKENNSLKGEGIPLDLKIISLKKYCPKLKQNLYHQPKKNKSKKEAKIREFKDFQVIRKLATLRGSFKKLKLKDKII